MTTGRTETIMAKVPITKLGAPKILCFALCAGGRGHITVYGECLVQVTSFTYLGVVIHDDLSWSAHVSSVCSRARKLLGFLYRNFRPAGRSCLSKLYRSLVLPVLDYCGAAWDPHQLFNITRLERVQHFAARLATGQWSADGDTLCQELGWSPLARRRIYQRLCLCRRILTGGSLIPDSSFSPLISRRSIRLAMNSCPLKQPLVRTNYHFGSFFVKTISYWNALPEQIISLSSPLAFKRHLKQFLVV